MLLMVPLMMLAGFHSIYAQSFPGPERMDWEGIPSGGGSFVQNFRIPTSVIGGAAAPRTVGMNFKGGYLVGIRLKQNLDEYWSADLDYTFANAPLEFTNLTPSIQSLTLSHSVQTLTYNVSYQFLEYWKRFRPYVRVGSGATLFYIKSSSKDQAAQLGVPLRDSWKFTFDWGGGFKYQLGPQVAVTFDMRDLVSGIPGYGLPLSASIVNGQYQPGLSRSGLLHQGQINLGVSFQWNDWY